MSSRARMFLSYLHLPVVGGDSWTHSHPGREGRAGRGTRGCWQVTPPMQAQPQLPPDKHPAGSGRNQEAEPRAELTEPPPLWRGAFHGREPRSTAWICKAGDRLPLDLSPHSCGHHLDPARFQELLWSSIFGHH